MSSRRPESQKQHGHVHSNIISHHPEREALLVPLADNWTSKPCWIHTGVLGSLKKEGVGGEREGGNEENLACSWTQMTVPGTVLREIRQP